MEKIMNWKYFKKLLSYIVINTSFAVSAWYGIGQGVEWASNLFMFMCWFFLATSIISCTVIFIYRIVLEGGKITKEDQEKFNVKTGDDKVLFAVHENIDIIYDICLVLFVVSYGWFGYATILTVSSILQYMTKKNVRFVMLFIKNTSIEEERKAQELEQTLQQIKEEEDRMTWSSDVDGNDDLRRMGVIDP